MSVSQNFIILGGQYITDFETTSVPEDHQKNHFRSKITNNKIKEIFHTKKLEWRKTFC